LGKGGGLVAVDWRSLESGFELGAGAFHELRYTTFLRDVLMGSDQRTGFAETLPLKKTMSLILLDLCLRKCKKISLLFSTG
jgi:hypothetical protein